MWNIYSKYPFSVRHRNPGRDGTTKWSRQMTIPGPVGVDIMFPNRLQSSCGIPDSLVLNGHQFHYAINNDCIFFGGKNS